MTAPSPLDALIHDAANKLFNLRCDSNVTGNSAVTRQDGKDFNSDLDALAHVLDPMFKAFGEYAQASFGLRQSAVDEYFTDRIRAAMDEATFAITQHIDGEYEQRADDAFHGRAA